VLFPMVFLWRKPIARIADRRIGRGFHKLRRVFANLHAYLELKAKAELNNTRLFGALNLAEERAR
jgi:hypothetical protein